MEFDMKISVSPCIFTINKVNVQRASSLQVPQSRSGRPRTGPGKSRAEDSTCRPWAEPRDWESKPQLIDSRVGPALCTQGPSPEAGVLLSISRDGMVFQKTRKSCVT